MVNDGVQDGRRFFSLKAADTPTHPLTHPLRGSYLKKIIVSFADDQENWDWLKDKLFSSQKRRNQNHKSTIGASLLSSLLSLKSL